MGDIKPLVSVVINSFNQSAFLEQTIMSVLDQDYPNVEILLVDGGSTDGSLEIIQRYANRLAWWVSEKDSGQAEGINKGLMRAKGVLAAWLNSDDYYFPGAISRALDCWQNHPEAALIYGDVAAVDERGRVTNRMRTGEWQLAELMEFHILNQPAVFMNRTMLIQAGYLDTEFHYLLDHKLWLGMASQGRMVHVPDVWAAGRFHPGAKNVAAAVRFGEDAYRLVSWMKNTTPYSQLGEGRWNRVEAGAHRINARYLLDGSRASEAFKSYWRGLMAHAPAIVPEWHRMLYALISLAGLGGLKRLFLGLRRLVRPVKMD
ncbi:MAG: hypothetical protein C0391_05555 [Anaerolinea sp.]|nr:hypothetical protein [Anaerolinea sp.]